MLSRLAVCRGSLTTTCSSACRHGAAQAAENRVVAVSVARSSFCLPAKRSADIVKAQCAARQARERAATSFIITLATTRYLSTRNAKHNVGKDWLEREVVRITAEHILTDSVIDFIADKVVALQAAEQADKSMLHYYEQQLKDTCTALNNIVKAIEAGIVTDTTKARLLELEERKAALETDIAKEKVSLPTLDKLQVVYFLEKFKGGDIDDKQYQRDIIDLFVNSVYIYDDHLTILYNVSGEHREISAEIVEKAASNAVNDVFDLMHVKSTICTKVEHSYYFIVSGLFGVVTKPLR